MKKFLTFTAGSLLVLAATSALAAQLGTERRIDRRVDRRADRGNPAAAVRTEARATDPRMRYHNNQWWYYTPQNQWMYYDNNNWTAYDANTYLPPRQYYIYGNYNSGPRSQGRYYTGYRGVWGPPASANFRANVGVGAPAGARTGGVAAGAEAGVQPAPAQPAPVQPAPAQPAPAQPAPAVQQPQTPAAPQQPPAGNQPAPAPAPSGQNPSS